MLGFDDSQLKVASKPCRPDPEKLLQLARERKEKIERGLDACKVLLDIPVNFNQDKSGLIMELIGYIQVGIWQEEQRIEQYLKEIDKG